MSKAFEKWLDNWFDPDDGGNHGDTAEAAWNAATENAARVCQEEAASCAISADAASTLDSRLECLTEQAAFLSAEKRIRKEKTE